MNLKNNFVIKNKDLQFRLPLYGDVDIHVKEGDKIKVGDKVYSSSAMEIKDSYYLPRLLNAKPEQCIDYIARVSGEYIVKGDLLAEKISRTGLMTKRVIAGDDGVVSTARIKSGYLDILDELKSKEYKANFKAIVQEVSLTKGILLKTEGLQVKLLAANPAAMRAVSSGQLVGDLEILGDGTLIYSSADLKGELANKIVYAGRFLDNDFAKLLYEHDPKAIIVYSMDYLVFNQIDIPIFVVGGFGHVRADGLVSSVLSKNKGKLIKVSLKMSSSSKLITVDIANGTYKNLDEDSEAIKENPYFASAQVGRNAKSLDIDSFGFTGKITDIDEEREIALLQNMPGEKILVPLSNIEIV